MIGRLNHVAIAVPDLTEAADQYKKLLGASVGEPHDEPDHGVTVIFVELPNTKIELLHPLGENSPINAFLEKNPLIFVKPFLMRITKSISRKLTGNVLFGTWCNKAFSGMWNGKP